VAILEVSGGSAGARFAAMDPQQAVALFLRNSLEHIRQRAGPAAVSPTRVAALYALVGRDQLAAEWFERAATEHDPDLPFALRDAEFAAMRTRPAFRAVATRLHRAEALRQP